MDNGLENCVYEMSLSIRRSSDQRLKALRLWWWRPQPPSQDTILGSTLPCRRHCRRAGWRWMWRRPGQRHRSAIGKERRRMWRRCTAGASGGCACCRGAVAGVPSSVLQQVGAAHAESGCPALCAMQGWPAAPSASAAPSTGGVTTAAPAHVSANSAAGAAHARGPCF